MRLGYFTMPLHPPGSDLAQTMEMDLAQIVALEALGFREAWVGEHFTSEWENIPCPDLFIAQALARTRADRAGHRGQLPAQPPPADAGPAHRPARPDGARALRLGHRLRRVPGRLPAAGPRSAVAGSARPDPGRPGRDPVPVGRSGAGRTRAPPLALPGARGRRRDRDPAARPAVPAPPPAHRRRRDRAAVGHAHPGRGAGLDPDEHQHRLHARAQGALGDLPGQRGRCRARGGPGRVAHRRDVYIGETSASARRDVLDGVLARDWRDYFLPVLRRAKMLIGPKLDPAMPDEASPSSTWRSTCGSSATSTR